MPSLPLKVQIAIRDIWNKGDGGLQTALKTLQDLLGHEVVIEPEWQLLLAALEEFYPDKTNFVNILAGCVEAWAKSMTELLEDSAHEDWTETVLEKSKYGKLRLFLEVSASDVGSTSWSEQRSGFVITLPKKKIFQPAELFPVFRGKLLACFESPKKAELPIRQGGAGDEWADVELDTTTGKPEVVEKPRAQPTSRSTTTVEFLPNVQSLPRPDELFLRPPYHLTVLPGHNEIEIQCSHSPTLKVLSEYLKRWCRINHHDTTEPAAVQITLCQSAFGLGELFDRLLLSTKETRYTNQFRVTTPMIVALIEGVLGYELVSSQQGTWTFRRDAEFKTL
ncbi:hypothetical protein QBC34DRAFT_134918 [Podospora aff. communis PSN243]|uniref:Uncharacterized protein n=1 Tax=Podospora aff. communis PSN243 TaxID=3040156 RepID=A0AAV9H1M1_9PEZI|nr:hypothetical protein QBC34DRAFT_134918 [Podospora aff. communis PSN243]